VGLGTSDHCGVNRHVVVDIEDVANSVAIVGNQRRVGFARPYRVQIEMVAVGADIRLVVESARLVPYDPAMALIVWLVRCASEVRDIDFESEFLGGWKYRSSERNPDGA
jgi:hypothetical protein